MKCWLAQFSELPCPSLWDPTGRMQRCHLISQQRIKRELAGLPHLTGIIWDPRAWVWGCAFHHKLFDDGVIRPERDDLPTGVLTFVEDYPQLARSLDAYGEP